ncbi:MAG: hypothetical protein RIC19_24315 [Phaeodactylibacter sp.]|uniref:hypothetical protein n=1 Tax=Phaeodactylibacter sp. TaxID=1940289 RepID=UPI0032F07EBE
MKKTFLLLALITIFASCNKDDDGKPSTTELGGEWNLVSVTCLCEPVSLEVGEHIWDFDLSENQLNVINNVAEQLHTILPTGSYPIIVTDSTVELQGIAYDYYFENERLFLADMPEVDGPLIEFVRE